MELKDRLKAEQKEAKKKYDQLEQQRKGAVEQRAELDRQLSIIVKEQILFQGEFRALEKALNGDKKK